MKWTILVALFFANLAHAQVGALCSGDTEILSCLAQGSDDKISIGASRIIQNPYGGQRPFLGITFNNLYSESFTLTQDERAPTGLFSVYANNQGQRTDFTASLAGRSERNRAEMGQTIFHVTTLSTLQVFKNDILVKNQDVSVGDIRLADVLSDFNQDKIKVVIHAKDEALSIPDITKTFDQSSKNAQELYLVGDVFSNISINVSGLVGAKGLSASDLCLEKVGIGVFNDVTQDDLIRQYQTENQITSCNSGLLNAISTYAPPTFCPAGYHYMSEEDNHTLLSFNVNRIRFKKKCVKTCNLNSDPSCGVVNPAGPQGTPPQTDLSYYYVDQPNSCPQGYTDSGLAQDYPVDSEQDYLTYTNEILSCSTESCSSAQLKRSFMTYYGATVRREAGQKGSYGGKAFLFVYEYDGLSVSYANGRNGDLSVNDISQIPTTKYCYQVLDNSLNFDDLASSAVERKNPVINLLSVTFYPFQVLEPTSLPIVNFPDRRLSESVFVYKKMDSSTRDFVYKEIVSKLP